MRKLTLALLVLLLAVLVWRGASVYPELPERMASHFGAGGAADGWMSKPSFFAVMGAVLALLLVAAVVTHARAPWIAGPQMVFWLATLALLGWVIELVYRANLASVETGEPAHLGGSMWYAMGAYLGFTLLWVVDVKRVSTG